MSNAAETPVPPLRRELDPLGVLFLTLSALSPGASVFVASASVVHSAGTGAALGFLAGGLIAALLAFPYAELASSFPHAGGPYGSVAGVLGSRAGFIVQALGLVSAPAFMAFTAWGFAGYVHYLVPGVGALSIGLAAIGVATVLSILNLRTNAWITGAFLLVELLAILILSVVGLTHPVRSIGEVLFHPVLPGAAGLVAPPFAAMALAVVGGSWACAGASWAMFFGEELHDAPRRIGGVIVAAGVIAGVLIGIPVALFAMSATELQTALAAESPYAEYLAKTAGPRLASGVSLGIAVAIFNCLVVSTIASSRFYYANGRDGIFPSPFNRVLTRLHGRFGSPWVATLLLGLVGTSFCLLGERMNILLLSGEVFSGALVALSVWVGRRRGRTGQTGYRTPWFPLMPVFGLLAAAGLVVATFVDREAGRPSMMILLGVIAVASGYYQWVLKPRGWCVQQPMHSTPGY